MQDSEINHEEKNADVYSKINIASFVYCYNVNLNKTNFPLKKNFHIFKILLLQVKKNLQCTFPFFLFGIYLCLKFI